jgi:O-antigen ligase
MNPQLAACLTFGFIGWLFYFSSRRGVRYSRSLWIPTLWTLIVASRPVGFWIAGGSGTVDFERYLDGSPADRNAFLILIFAGFIILFRRIINWASFRNQNRWFIAYYIFCALSVVWSDYPFVAFKRWIKEIGTVIMILIILTEKDREKAIQEVFCRVAFILLPASILVIKYYLEVGRSYNPWTGEAMLCGVTTDKNALGRLSFLSILFLMWRIFDQPAGQSFFKKVWNRAPELMSIVMGFWLLLKADSSTSKGCFGVAILAILAARTKWVQRHHRMAGFFAVIGLVFSLVVLSVPDLRGMVAESLGRRADLTDRTDIWSGAFGLGTDPLLGSGYSSVWLTTEGRALKEHLQMAHSHNGYLETYLNTGLIGLALLTGILGAAGKSLLQQVALGNRSAAIFAGLFFGCVIYNYTEVGYDNMSLVGLALWLLAIRIKRRDVASSSKTRPAVEQAWSRPMGAIPACV